MKLVCLRRQRRNTSAGLLLVVIALLSSLAGQLAAQLTAVVTPVTALDYIRPAAVPLPLQPQFQALGDRLSVAGKERVILVGTFTDSRGATPAQLTWELPGKFQLQEMAPQGRTLVFDGSQATNSGKPLTAAEADVLESLGADLAESFFSDIVHGAAWRWIGGRFRTDKGQSPTYTGPYYDIYQTTSRVKVSNDPAPQAKFFLFNSSTKLLDIVCYTRSTAGQDRVIQTKFENWAQVLNQQLPGRITRIENGQVVFSFQVLTPSLAAR